MLNILPQRKTLEQWIQQLDNTRLPVYQAQRELALQALQDSSKSLGDIALVISQSPSIAFIIMREANRGYSAVAEPLQTLDNAMARLGLQRCESLLKSLQDDQETDIPLTLRQVWLIGHHLNIQAIGLFSTRMARLAQEIHWGSLLFLSPTWPLLTRYPDLFTEWERRVLGDNEPAEMVERELIGMPLTALCLGLAEHWKLPQWIIEGYRLLNDNPKQLVSALHIARQFEHPLLQQEKLDQRPKLSNWLNRPANTLIFTCGLVMAAHNSWGSEQCLRWQRLISLYLNQELADVQQTTHQLAVKHAHLQRHRDLWQPAQALLWPWEKQRLRQSHIQASAPAPKKEDLAEWRTHCEALLRSPSPFSNILQLTGRVSQTLQSCGMRNICIMILDKQGQHAQINHQYGIRANILPQTLTLQANPVIEHLLKQPTHIILNSSNSARIQPHLPTKLVRAFSGTQWVLASLSNGNRVVMLIAAGQSARTLNPASVQGFKKTLECVERALMLFNSSKP